jgi:hypothetical protein
MIADTPVAPASAGATMLAFVPSASWPAWLAPVPSASPCPGDLYASC